MKKPKAPKLVTVAIFTTITIIFWVFISLYNIIMSTPDINVDPELLEPINPNLEKEALDRLEGRIFFEEGETNSPVIIRENTQISPSPEEEVLIPENEEVAEGTTPVPLPTQ
jgi:hypothetical protein